MPQFPMQRTLPNSVGILVLGICSIVFCWCYGIIGLICGIIALVLATKAKRLYTENPTEFTESSYKNMNAGRICAIIGMILSGIYVLYVIFIFVTVGSAMMGGFGALNGFNNY